MNFCSKIFHVQLNCIRINYLSEHRYIELFLRSTPAGRHSGSGFGGRSGFGGGFGNNGGFDNGMNDGYGDGDGNISYKIQYMYLAQLSNSNWLLISDGSSVLSDCICIRCFLLDFSLIFVTSLVFISPVFVSGVYCRKRIANDSTLAIFSFRLRRRLWRWHGQRHGRNGRRHGRWNGEYGWKSELHGFLVTSHRKIPHH